MSAAQGSDAAAALGGVPARASGRLSEQPVLPPFPSLAQERRGGHAHRPQGGREAVRRLRRATGWRSWTRTAAREQPVETFVAILGASRADLRGGQLQPTERRLDPPPTSGRCTTAAAARRRSSRTTCAAPSAARTPTSRASIPPSDAFADHYGLVIMPARVRRAPRQGSCI